MLTPTIVRKNLRKSIFTSGLSVALPSQAVNEIGKSSFLLESCHVIITLPPWFSHCSIFLKEKTSI